MVFKLVRTDGEEPCKILLPVGIHVIGRGSFLDCDDTRVSLKHGILEVTEDSVTVKALHKNPCFYIKKQDDTTHVLRQNDTVELGNADKFGLLPCSYWYELVYCTEVDIKQPPEKFKSAQRADGFSKRENNEMLKAQQILPATSSTHSEQSDDKELFNLEINESSEESQGSEPKEDEEIDQEKELPTIISPNTSEDDQSEASASNMTEDQQLPSKRSCIQEESKEDIKEVKMETD